MATNQSLAKLALFALLTCAPFLLTGCGSYSTAAKNKSSQSSSGSNYYYGDADSDDDGSNQDDVETEPAYTENVTGTGYSTVEITVRTGKILKLKFKPKSGTNVLYTKLGVYVTVHGTTLNSGMLRNGDDGMGAAETSAVMNFSSAVAAKCTSTGCRKNVVIQIHKPNYDFWCIYGGTYCPWNRVSDGHDWNGELQIQTDDTPAI